MASPQLRPTSDEMPHFAALKLEQMDDAEDSIQFERGPSIPSRITDSMSAALLQAELPRTRTRSPFSRSHLRSHSAASAMMAPPMARTKSLPSVAGPNSFASSPSHSPVRHASGRSSSPLRSFSGPRGSPRRSFDETFPGNVVPSFMDIESIAEDSELDLTQPTLPFQEYQTSTYPPAFHSNTLQRGQGSRRRPTSPLSQYSQSPPPSFASPGPFVASSPSLRATKFNEPYPGNSAASFALSSGSSVPSTPSSLRSRSPSVSSLETIPDSPDAEEAAMEAHNMALLKAAADAAEAAAASAAAERKLNAVGLGVPDDDRSTLSVTSNGVLKDKRKRWSVCGAERRGDFEMETIWED